VADGQEAKRLDGNSGLNAVFSPDGKTVAAGSQEGAVNLWSVPTGQPKEPLRWHVRPVLAVAFSPDGRWLAFGGVDKTVQVVDRASGQSWRRFPSGGLIAGLAFSPDSQTLGVVSEPPGPCLRLWDLATEQERTPPEPAIHRFGIAFHPAGDRVLTGSADGIVRLWETAPGTGGNRDFDFSKVRPVGAGGVDFAPSGRHFAVGLANGTIALFATPPAGAR
jgi:hypothetical protein